MINLDIFTFTFDQLYWLMIILIVETVLIILSIVTMIVNWKSQWQKDKVHLEKVQELSDKLEERSKRLVDISDSNNRRFNYINSVFMTMKDGIVVFNQSQRIILMNPSAQTYLKMNQSVFFDSLDHNQNQFYLFLKEMVHKTSVTNETQVLFYNDNEYSYEVFSSIIDNKYRKDDKLGVLVAIVDVTEKRRVEKIRKEFVENVSHEFRTPMTLISGVIEMLKMWDNIDVEDRNKALDIIDIQTNRLKRLISELLTLSEIEGRIQLNDQMIIDVEDILLDMIEMFTPIANKKGITLLHDIQLSYPLVEGNEEFFYQAISNVLDNAIKYTSECGWVSLVSYADNQFCYIKIEDNGVGMQEHHLDRIFDRFYRVDEHRSSKTGGSGIGLSIVKDVVTLMNGNIEVDSKLNQGSTFIIKLPIIKESVK